MSIVVIEKDQYMPARQIARMEEKKIDVRFQLNKWTMRGLFPQKLVSLIIAAIIVPLLIFWFVLIAGIFFSFALCLTMLKVLGQVFSRWRA